MYELLQDINYDQIIAAKEEFKDGVISLKEVTIITNLLIIKIYYC